MLKLNRHAIWIIVVGCFSTAPVLAQPISQSFGDTSDLRNQRPQESSILVRDDQPSRSSALTVRPQRDDSPAAAGFKIPANPTASDFMNPADDDAGSNAVGTFAYEKSDGSDRFSSPQPPAVPDYHRSAMTGDNSRSDRRTDNRQPPIAQNGLRSSNPSGHSDASNPTRFGRPAADRMTAATRFSDPDPAPPAAMPQVREDRFNAQLYSSRPQTARGLPVHQTPATNVSPRVPDQLTRTPATPLRDNRVAPTSFSQAIQRNANSPANTNQAEQITERYSIDNATGALPGEPISLVEMFQQPIPVPSRQTMVNQYWETWFDWASMQNATAYKDWLDSIPKTGSASDQGLLAAAQSFAQNEVLAAEIQLGKSQSKLQQFMPQRQSDLLPLPGDLPLVERYETHYELYEARRMMPANLRGINQVLPKTLTLISNRANTVQMAQTAADQTLNGYRSRQGSLGSVLEAARVWRASEQDLLASITSYNQAIADYALNITRRYTNPDQTAAMLIGAPKIKQAQTPLVRQTAAQQNIGQAGNRANQGFGGQQNNRGQRTASRTQDRQPQFDQGNIGQGNGRPAGAGTNWGDGNAVRGKSSSSGSANSRPSLGTSSRASGTRGGTSSLPLRSSSRQLSPAATPASNRSGTSTDFGGGGAASAATGSTLRPQTQPPSSAANRSNNQFGGIGR